MRFARWGFVAALLVAGCRRGVSSTGQRPRYVSLAPATDETLFAIGAGADVVARSRYCDHPPEAMALPDVGTMFEPNLDQIAAQRPTLLFGTFIEGTRTDATLARIAPTVVPRWLTLTEVVAGVRAIGHATHHETEAERLATQLTTRLQVPFPSTGPRTLLVIGDAQDPSVPQAIYYIKRNSLTGQAFAAAGGHNAIDRDVAEAPMLSQEQLLALNPEVLFLLFARDGMDAATRARYVAPWRRLITLAAVQRDAVRVVDSVFMLTNGPRVLQVPDVFTAALRGLPAGR